MKTYTFRVEIQLTARNLDVALKRLNWLRSRRGITVSEPTYMFAANGAVPLKRERRREHHGTKRD